jgi:diaminopimelate epimerase
MLFTKMHGIGNDYVYIDGFKHTVADPAAMAIEVSNRHTGIGSDGLILVLPPADGVQADVRMRMFNADGSESEMCGNGIRCVAKFAHDHGLTTARPMRVQTGRGVLSIDYTLDAHRRLAQATVDMGEPILDLPQIPVDPIHAIATPTPHVHRITTPVGTFLGTFVSMGNPHVTIFVDDVAAVELEKVGPVLERHAAFPRRINVHFVQVHSRSEVTMRTWERGSGITLACGTGACAVGVSAVLTNRTDRAILAHLPGGDLHIHWSPTDNHVHMTGPATEVFTGNWPKA